MSDNNCEGTEQLRMRKNEREVFDYGEENETIWEKSVTRADMVKRVYPELNLAGQYASALAIENGWTEDEDVNSFLEQYDELVSIVKTVSKKPGKYTQEQLQQVLDAIDEAADKMYSILNTLVHEND